MASTTTKQPAKTKKLPAVHVRQPGKLPFPPSISGFRLFTAGVSLCASRSVRWANISRGYVASSEPAAALAPSRRQETGFERGPASMSLAIPNNVDGPIKGAERHRSLADARECPMRLAKRKMQVRRRECDRRKPPRRLPYGCRMTDCSTMFSSASSLEVSAA